MQVSMVGMVVAAEDTARTAAWYVEHIGLRVGVDLGWYVNLQHPDHPTVSVDLVQRDHESWPEPSRGQPVNGTLLAFLVDDVDAEHDRMRAAGLEVVLPLVTEPWGQRRFQVAGPDGVLVEVLQMVPADPDWMAANGLAG
jgi:catechol 2,3-dioxygenase-like lactoylglutathione lyase family enzyme